HVRIDKLGCIGSTYFVCDYKTNSRMKDQFEADEDRQLAMYSIWVKDKFKDAEKVILLWDMLKFDKEVVSQRTDAQLKDLTDETVELIKEVEACTEFLPTVSGLCNYCVYKSMCPSFKHEAELEKKTVKEFKEDDGVKLVDEYSKVLLEKNEAGKKLENLKKDILDFAKQKGIDVVFGSNKKAAIKERESVVYPEDKKELMCVLKEKGLYEEYSMICYPRLNSKIINKNVDKSVLELVEKGKTYSISISNINK
ncbi:MAG: PD-(D/E)XK nuclease family protein, partial [Candidatus Diapherotrites archaeon]|nr:PD-(D/E)XK nuclease family protein [Candidatus Diapherotrites archaeon]